MNGNAYPYTPQTWAQDIQLAHTYGIDGFALNVGSDVWQFAVCACDSKAHPSLQKAHPLFGSFSASLTLTTRPAHLALASNCSSLL